MFVDPRDAIVVEDAQIAGLVIVDQQLDDMGLVVVLRHGLRLLQPINNMTDGIGIAPGSRPHLFLYLAIALDQRGVESIGRGFWIILVCSLLSGIEVFGLLLGDTFIEMAGRGLYQVFAIGLVDALGQDGRVENNGKELLTKGVHRLPIGQGQARSIHLLQALAEIMLRETGLELLRTIVMIDAIGEPEALEIDLKGLEIRGIMGYGQVTKNGLQHLANAEVITAKLVESNVAPIKGGLREVINQTLLT